MGISIDNNGVVSINMTNRIGVDVNWKDNPRKQNIYGYEVLSVFQRLRVSRDDGINISDGNPLVHAVKARPDSKYTLDNASDKRLRWHGRKIIDNIFTRFTPDVILEVPSSSNLNNQFAAYLHRVSGAQNHSPFKKRTVQEVLDTKIPVNQTPRKFKTKYRNAIVDLENLDPNSDFVIKDINNKIRHLFEPIAWQNTNFNLPNTPNVILVVDDVYSTGTSIGATMKVAHKKFPNAQVYGVTIFSELNAEKA